MSQRHFELSEQGRTSEDIRRLGGSLGLPQSLRGIRSLSRSRSLWPEKALDRGRASGSSLTPDPLSLWTSSIRTIPSRNQPGSLPSLLPFGTSPTLPLVSPDRASTSKPDSLSSRLLPLVFARQDRTRARHPVREPRPTPSGPSELLFAR
ncbi:hypothetical protein MA16_Dca026728 [Dendrobium catenatum]|uniref:Uncharacterized protein n=1 Tax=Dendrobium catenatum TaxID=906689 RepID=A0A2I0X9L1_9ASPA|nr:hypothetical protein MA16_Dca026728 [Dendrobium catenatum]